MVDFSASLRRSTGVPCDIGLELRYVVGVKMLSRHNGSCISRRYADELSTDDNGTSADLENVGQKAPLLADGRMRWFGAHAASSDFG